MKTKRFNISAYIPAIAILLPLLIGCKKDISDDPETVVTVTPVVRPSGNSIGEAVSKVIGASGGTIQTVDSVFTVTIPEGALSTDINIAIEPVTNTNIAGIGKAYRLTPHGQTFSKPVTITYSWAPHADSIGLLQTLGLAYQMESGIWKFTGADSFDAGTKTVSFKSTHFSDWSLMNRITLSPHHANLETGEKQQIKALLFTEADWDNLFVPLVNDPGGPYNEPGYPVGTPVALPSKFVKSWKQTGPGNLTEQTKNTVEYHAPSSVNGVATATVILELNAPVAGTYLLVSNISILGDGWIELSINGSSPVRFPASPVVKMGSRYLLSNPEDEGGGHFLLTWNGEQGSHAFDLGAYGTRFHFLTGPNVGYNSMYIPGPKMPLQPSEGSVNITKLGNGRAEGNFNIMNVGVGDQFRPEATAQGRFSAKLFVQ